MASKTYEIAFQLGAKLTSGFSGAFSKATNDMKKMEAQTKAANKSFLGIGSGAKKVLGIATGFAATMTAGLGLKQMFTAAQASQQTLSQMDNVLKSTGNASGMTKNQLLALAAAQGKVTTFSKGTNIASENMLLTFTNIGKTVFPQALSTVNDMSQALGQDTKNSAIQLGKALNNPITGITSLSRVGVTFTEQQKSQIKAMVQAGNVAGAQKVILGELNKEFGGSAVAAGKTFTGQMTILKNQISGVGTSIATTLMPYVTNFMSSLSSHMPQIQSIITGVISTAAPYISAIAKDIDKIAQNILPQLGSATGNAKNQIISLVNGGFSVLKNIMDWIAQHGELTKVAIIGIGSAFATIKVAQKVVEITSGLKKITEGVNEVKGIAKGGKILENIFGVPPAILGIVAVIAVVAGAAYLVIKNWSKIKTFFTGLWSGIKSGVSSFWNWLKGFVVTWGPVLLTVISPIIGIPILIIQHWSQIKAKISAVFNSIKTSIAPHINNIKNTVSTGFKAVVTTVSNVFKNIVKVVSTVFKAIGTAILSNPLTKIVEAIFKGILAVVIIVVYKIYTTATSIWNKISSVVGPALKRVLSVVKAIWNSIYTAISSVVIKVLNIIISIWNQIGSAISAVLNAVRSIVVAIWTRIYTSISTILRTIWSVIVSIWNTIYGSISAVLTTIWTFIVTVWNNIYNSVSTVVTTIWNTIVTGFTSAYNSVTGIFQSMYNTIVSIFQGIWNAIKAIINTGIGMINGFIGGVNKVIGVANNVPGVNIGTVGTIPQLASGGYIQHRPGGILANIGEGNEDEIVSPVSRLKSIVNSSNKNTSQSDSFTFSPQIIIQGNASKDDIKQALLEAKKEFKEMIEAYKKDRKRLSFDS